MPLEYRDAIVTGDARELVQRIPDESVDLIFTDPVYDRIDDYRWLAEIAARVLKMDTACLTWYAHAYLPAIFQAMVPPLSYAWSLHWQRYGPISASGRPGISVITPCLWFEKGRSRTRHPIADWASSLNGGQREWQHAWAKPANVLAKWITAFTPIDAVVLDPFTGSGTVPAVCKMLGRRYVAFEIDPLTAERARERVANTQPPLPGLECEEQLPLEV